MTKVFIALFCCLVSGVFSENRIGLSSLNGIGSQWELSGIQAGGAEVMWPYVSGSKGEKGASSTLNILSSSFRPFLYYGLGWEKLKLIWKWQNGVDYYWFEPPLDRERFNLVSRFELGKAFFFGEGAWSLGLFFELFHLRMPIGRGGNFVFKVHAKENLVLWYKW